MDEAELDKVRERIEWSMARQRDEYGDDKDQWPWATVRDTTVLTMLAHIWELELRIAELEGAGGGSEETTGPGPLTREELDDLLGIGSDAADAAYPMPEDDQRRLGDLAVRAWQLLAGGYDP